MKTRLIGLLACIMTFCISVFSGCALVTLDRNRYLNEVVASVMDKETGTLQFEIRKKDLIEAYDSYGYYFTQYYGQTEQEALDHTLELLVNRQITIKAQKAINAELTEKEKTYLWQETADALEDRFKSYLNSVLGITNNSSTESDARVFKGYNKNAEPKKIDGKYEIIKSTVPTKTLQNFTYTTARDFENPDGKDRALIWTNFFKFVTEAGSTSYNKAFSNYFKKLKTDEKGLNLSTDMEPVFLREIDSIYKSVYENYMISKYDENFINYSQNSTVTVDQILDLYAGMVRSSYTQYEVEGDSSYESNVQSNSNNIYYYRENNDDTKFFQVAHILFKFDDSTNQAERYKEIKATKYSEEQDYKDAIAALCSEVKPVVRQKNDNGEYIETKNTTAIESNSSDLADYIKQQVDKKETALEKAELFRQFIYKYNDDPGMINAENNYTIGVNASEAEDGEEFKVYSNYVQEFTDAAVELYKKGKVGEVSTPVVTENGIHILFYVGQLDNLFAGIDENFSLTNDEADPNTGLTPIEVLNSKYINIFLQKTYFDVIYDTLVTDNFATFQNLNMKELRSAYNIVVNKSGYSDLIK